MAKQTYYSIKEILKQNARYNIIYGERSNGKSYSPKEYAIYCAYTGKDMFTGEELGIRRKLAYMRRWKEEIRNYDVEQYFADMSKCIKEITNNEYDCIVSFQRKIFLGIENGDGTKTRGKEIGYSFALTSATHYKSLAYPEIFNIITEEFITDEGYLPREVSKFTSIISTIARREIVHVFMIGNTINRMCPYFREWELTGIPRQKQGTIEVYNQITDQIDDNGEKVIIKIAVEYCQNFDNNTKMFFGHAAKTITSGSWDTQIFPHLDNKLRDYRCYYRILYNYNDFQFVICLLRDFNKDLFLFVYPNTKKRDDINRIVSTEFSTNRMTTFYLTVLTKYDKIIMRLIEDKKIRFADNLTGTEFWQIKKERGRF